ncbi:hypothetical protein MYCTH_2054510, partial [Thermothelomyces thermophilus ATCC 42464]
KKKVKLDLPNKFDRSKEKLVRFLTTIRAYLCYYNDKFLDNKAKVLYIATRLEGKALRWFEPM